MKAKEFVTEKWSQKYKNSINCSHPKGFSQRAHCAGKKNHNESHEVMEMTYPNCVKNEAVAEGEGSYPEVLYHGSTQEINGPLTPRQAHDIGGAPGSNKNAIYATDDPNFAIAYSLAERGSDTGTLGWKQDPHLIFFGGKIRHGQNVYLYTLPTRDQQGNPLFTPGGADAEWHSVPGVTAVTPIKVKELPVDRYLGLLRKPTPDEQKVFQANQARDKAKRGMAEGKITLSTDPNWYGATVDNYQATGPVVNIPANQLVGFEPDAKMNQPKSKANVEKIVAGLKQGAKLPPLLIRKYKNGYQVLDGHHRFWAYKLLGVKSIPAQIVPDSDIEEISKQGVAESTELAEEFDLIESVIEDLAERNQVDAEVIWEDLETLDDDELYVFATTTPVMEDWQKVNKKDKTDGMSTKAVKAYRREHPGSKLKTAVTTKPSKLKRGSKASKRRKSYCSRSKGQMNMHNISCAKTPDKAICKARRRWNC